jgi:hypothetical protein
MVNKYIISLIFAFDFAPLFLKVDFLKVDFFKSGKSGKSGKSLIIIIILF